MALFRRANRPRFATWAKSYSCQPTRVHTPQSEAEVVEIVARARRDGQTVRAVGAGHSWSDVACTDGQMVSLDRMDRVLEIDADASLVTVEAGIRLRELVAHLLDLGLALPNLGSIAEQSVAGVISTGTHGTGIGLGNLSSMVERLRLVTGTGEVVEIDAETPELLAAARVAVGSLGIITEVTLRCCPAFRLHERSWTLGFDEALREMDDLIEAHDHVKLWWLPHTGRVQVFAADRTERAATPPDLARRLDDSGLLTPVFAGVIGVGNRMPAAIPWLNRLVCQAYFVDYELVANSHEIFNLAMPPVHLEAEWGFDRADAAGALDQLRALIEWEAIGVNFITEVRFVDADDIWLSPCYQRQSCQLGAYIGATGRWRDYFAGFQAIAERLGARPHWGKMFEADRSYLRQAFPRLDDFERVRRRLDPDGVFVNAFVERVFSPS